MNPKSLKNLKPFKPGQSGNPAGRPKRPIGERYVAMLETPLEESERKKLGLQKGATYGDAIVLVNIRRAMQGDIRAIKEIREAAEGKFDKSIADTGPTLSELCRATQDEFVLPTHLALEARGLCSVCGGKRCEHKRCATCDGCDECPEQPDPK